MCARWAQDSNALAAAEASEWTDVKPVLRLGQRVIHKSKGFQGIVVGWDKACCEADEWRSRNDVTALDKVLPRYTLSDSASRRA